MKLNWQLYLEIEILYSLEQISVHMIIPFLDTGHSKVVNIATGAKVSKKICKDLTHVKEKATKTCLDTVGKQLSMYKS